MLRVIARRRQLQLDTVDVKQSLSLLFLCEGVIIETVVGQVGRDESLSRIDIIRRQTSTFATTTTATTITTVESAAATVIIVSSVVATPTSSTNTTTAIDSTAATTTNQR